MSTWVYRTGNLLISLVLLTACVHAQDGQSHSTEHNSESSLNLSSDLNRLLLKEMQAVQQGMMNLVPAIASGNWKEISVIGNQIHDSYIIRQNLTDAQVDELHHVVPAEFFKLDQSFHKYAGMLAHAAEMKNADAVNFYFYKLNDACVQCHSQFAHRKFPGLLSVPRKSGHH